MEQELEQKPRQETWLFQNQEKPLDVPREIAKALPPMYEQEAFSSDLVSVFNDPVPQMFRIRNIQKRWAKENINNYSMYPSLYFSEEQIRQEIANYYRFFRRFARSGLRKDILEIARGNPRRAASYLMEILENEINSTEQRDGKGKKSTSLTALKMVQEHGKTLGIPFSNKNNKNTPSSETRKLMKRAYNIHEIMEKINIRYDSYAQKSYEKKECQIPEDIEIERMRSYSASEIARIPITEYLAEDFYEKFARRELKRITYMENIQRSRKIVMLIDVSGSMETNVGNLKFLREEFAISSAILLLQNCLKGGHNVHLVRFDRQPLPEIEGTPDEIIRTLMECKFTGGGTSIDNAIEKANSFSPDEIILITDGNDVIRKTPNAPMTTYICEGKEGYDQGSKIRKISKQIFFSEDLLK